MDERLSAAPRTVTLAPEEIAGFLLSEIKTLAERAEGRIAVGLAGGPGAGKSTVSGALVKALDAAGLPAVAVPMDGFHMRHAKLESLGIAHEKGMPHTFEAAGFVAFLQRAKLAKEPVSGPVYTRDIEDVTEDGYVIAGETKILVVEGNYLLLDSEPWGAVKNLLDLAVHIAVPREEVLARLLKRHGEFGLFNQDHIEEHVMRVDMANYDIVAATAPFADVQITVRIRP